MEEISVSEAQVFCILLTPPPLNLLLSSPGVGGWMAATTWGRSEVVL